MTKQAWQDWLSAQAVAEMSDTDAGLAYCCALGNRGLLAISGEDAERFLQGQLTCDLRALQPGQLALGACCEPKGRMLASFHVLRSDDGFLLDLDRSLVAPLQDALKKYAMLFRKLSMRDASEDYCRLAVWGDAAGTTLKGLGETPPEQPGSWQDSGDLRLLRLPVVAGWQLWLRPERASELGAALLDGARLVAGNNWTLREIRAGLGWVTAASSQLWIPQMLGYGELGAISFNKGCYTGQEIIARLQYRGQHKRQCRRLTADGVPAEPPPAGSRIETTDGRAAGELVVLAASGPSRSELLAVLRQDCADAPGLLLDGLNLTLDGA